MVEPLLIRSSMMAVLPLTSSARFRRSARHRWMFFEKTAANRNREQLAKRFPKFLGTLNASGNRRYHDHFARHLKSCEILDKQILSFR
jgi:hypothetical protein